MLHNYCGELDISTMEQINVFLAGLTGADHADDEYMNHNLATNGTGPCLGADRYRFYPQNCSTRAKFVCECKSSQNDPDA